MHHSSERLAGMKYDGYKSDVRARASFDRSRTARGERGPSFSRRKEEKWNSNPHRSGKFTCPERPIRIDDYDRRICRHTMLQYRGSLFFVRWKSIFKILIKFNYSGIIRLSFSKIFLKINNCKIKVRLNLIWIIFLWSMMMFWIFENFGKRKCVCWLWNFFSFQNTHSKFLNSF